MEAGRFFLAGERPAFFRPALSIYVARPPGLIPFDIELRSIIMYIPALDPPLSGVGISDASVRGRAIIYGHAMLKLALLTGARPTISENQVFDSRAVLRAALDPSFRGLIRDGFIKLAYVNRERDYRAALAEFVSRPTAISPGWGNIDPKQLREVLLRRRVIPPEEWNDEEKQLFEGLRYLSAIPKDPLMLVTIPSVSFSQRLASITARMGELLPQEDVHRPIQEYLYAVAARLSKEEINTRSAWIAKACDSNFNSKFDAAIQVGAPNATIALAVMTYNEMLSESVAEGRALRSVAFTPFAMGQTELSDIVPAQLLLLSVDQGGLLVDTSRESHSVLRVSDWFTPSEEDVDKLAALPWELVKAVVTHELFSQAVSDASKSEEGFEGYLTWLKREIGIAFVQAQTKTESRVARGATEVVFKGGLTVATGPIGQVVDWILTATSLKSLTSRYVQKLAARRRSWGVEASVEVIGNAVDRATLLQDDAGQPEET